jgi:hypothetical protein
VVGVRHSVFVELCARGLLAKSFFGHGTAAESPRAADEFGGGHFFDGAEGGEVGPEGGAEGVVFFAFVGWTQLLVAKRPNFWLLRADFAFVSSVLVPVEALAFWRLASIWAWVDIWVEFPSWLEINRGADNSS